MPDAVAAPSAAPDTSAPASTPEPSSAAPSTPSTPEPKEPKTETTPEPKAEPAPSKRYKLKIKGEEREYDEDFVVRAAQKGVAADEAFRKAAEERKAFESAKQRLLSPKIEDRLEAMKELGYSPEQIREFAINLVKREMELEQEDPRDKQIRELREAQQKTKAEQEQREAAAKEQERTAYAQEFAGKLNKEVLPALQKRNLPATEMTVGLVAGAIRAMAMEAEKAGVALDWRDLVEDASDRVQYELQGWHKSLVGGLKGADLVNFLGKGVVEEVRRHLIAEHRAKSGGRAPQVTQTTPRTTTDEPRRPLTQDEWREQMMAG